MIGKKVKNKKHLNQEKRRKRKEKKKRKRRGNNPVKRIKIETQKTEMK